MRARNLKPGLFKNELLGTANPLYTIVYAGLWCMADREGRLPDIPRRIHMEVNPARHYRSTQVSLEWLASNKFIERYEHEGEKYISIPQFRKHQFPHIKEPKSTIPAPYIKSAEPVQAPDEHQSSPSSSLNPSSLIPDSLLLPPGEEHPLPPQGGGSGLTANGRRKPRAERDRSLAAWRELTELIDQVAATTTLTWQYVAENCKNPPALKAAESVGFRLIADRDKFTTSDLQARFREAYERRQREFLEPGYGAASGAAHP